MDFKNDPHGIPPPRILNDPPPLMSLVNTMLLYLLVYQ
nr:MAG TPA: hypothetical protein [Caudoviricetes sp.]